LLIRCRWKEKGCVAPYLLGVETVCFDLAVIPRVVTPYAGYPVNIPEAETPSQYCVKAGPLRTRDQVNRDQP
jgi:hypothetical protein